MGIPRRTRRGKMQRVLVAVALSVVCAFAAPLTTVTNTLGNVDLALSVFDQKAAQSADASKNYIIFAYDKDACLGDMAEKCAQLQKALGDATAVVEKDPLVKYRATTVFGKANKDDFPDHKKDFEKAKVPLPAILFWPAGHSRPSCKYNDPNPQAPQVLSWVLEKLKEEEDDSLLQLDEGDNSKIDETTLPVCSATDKPTGQVEEPACSDVIEAPSTLVQVGKTEKIWDFAKADTKFIGPADNSLPHDTHTEYQSALRTVDAAVYQSLIKQNKWVALYFQAPWCHYCSCIGPIWDGVSSNLVGSQRQPDLVVGKVDGDASPELRSLLNVTVYPTFLLINKDGTKVLGRYLGPRKVFELSNWIEDLIVADENPILKHQFDLTEQGKRADGSPVFPYTGPDAFKGDAKMAVQALASLDASAGLSLTGNDFDECLESDEFKFTAPGAALLVHYSSDKRSLELDSTSVSTATVPQKLTVIDFYASWCPHCQKLNPVWDSLTADLPNEKVVVGKVEMEAHPDVKKQFGIHRFPTIMYFEPGKPMAYDESRRYTGQRDVEHLKQWVQNLMMH
eukprot:c2971_g1_i1.p1 GENE.c2971_g1_i1~~c2971_g1_i1.p1  ORF type:complete len:566 (-),score=122.17 c2971_g1_i1:46-1743(-)